MILVWFRRDLRIQDNPALQNAVLDAARTGQTVEAIYLHCDELYGDWPLGGASCWYLHHSLQSLSQDLAARGIPMHCQVTANARDFVDQIKQREVTSVYWNRVVEPQYETFDARMSDEFSRVGLQGRRFHDDCLLMPEQLSKDDGTPYKVFTPFWRRAQAVLDEHPPFLQRLCADVEPVSGPVEQPADSVSSLALLPQHNWHSKLHEHWTPGEPHALSMLASFLDEAAVVYETGRDLPAETGTSRLSAALHFGEVSVVRALHECNEVISQLSDETAVTSIRRFMSELGWREFGRHVMTHFPETANQSLNRAFDDDSLWNADPDDQQLRAWQRGETGIPLVDAGMRELWHTGWMHNRVRMVVGSFLTKNLGIHWRHGARWFWDTLVDADLASNTMGWQWVSGCGTDAAPYFRIFNPHTQAKKFDPDSRYINRWLPSDALIPEIIDLKLSREKALQRYQHTMSEARARAAAS